MFARDIIHREVDTLSSHVYSYRLTLLEGTEEVTVHSATNTHDHRSDVGKFEAERLKERVVLDGITTDEHTWFPPYKWTAAYCSKCGALLGWGFSKPETEEEMEFFALVLTRLKPRRASEREITLMLALGRLRVRSRLLARMRSLITDGSSGGGEQHESEAQSDVEVGEDAQGND